MRTTVVLPDSTWHALRQIAKAEGTTATNLLREAANDRIHGNLATRLHNHEQRLTQLEQHTGLKPPPTTHKTAGVPNAAGPIQTPEGVAGGPQRRSPRA